MKVAIFTETYLPQTSAVETQVFILAKSLKKMGHDVLVVTSDMESDECYSEQDALFCPARPARNVYGQKAKQRKLSRLKERLDEFNPDVIHLFTFWQVGGLGLKYALAHDLPLMTTVQKILDPQSAFGKRKVLGIADRARYRSTFHKALAFSDHITSPSVKICKRLRPICRNKQIRPIPLFINTELFTREAVFEEKKREAMRRRLGLGGKTGILSVGGLTRENRTETLLENWVKTGSKLQLVLVGSGPELENLRSKANLLGIASRVSFAGVIPHEEMNLCYHLCTAFVSAGVSDSMKAAPLEAIACGLPAILPKESPDAGLITEGVNGFLYANSVAFLDIVKNFEALDPEKELMMKKLVGRTVETMSIENQAKAFLKSYVITQKQHYKQAEELE